MARQNRFIIKHPTLGYLSGHDIAGTFDSIEVDAGKKVVHTRELLAPKFDARVQAVKFATEQDAKNHLTHKDLADPAAFADCVLEPEELDE